MKRVVIALAAVVALSGCTTIQGQAQSAYTRMCNNQIVVRAAMNLAIQEATRIDDLVIRNAAIMGAQATLRLLDTCPIQSVGSVGGV